MILAEKKSSNEIRQEIENGLSQRYSIAFRTDGYICFCHDGLFFKVSVLKWKDDGRRGALAEYANSELDARNGVFGEDGALFYTDEISEEEIVDAMIREIED